MTPALTEPSLVTDAGPLPEKTVSVTTATEIPSPTETNLDLAPPLLPVEQIGPKGWIRCIYHFELPDNYDADHLTHILKTAYKAMKDRVPIAGCEVVPLEDSKQAGLLKLRHYGDEIEDFLAKDLRGDETFPTFAELRDRGFPSSALLPEKVCRRGMGGEWPQAGDRLNVTWMQANFIRGGLLLNMLFLHAYADGTTAYKFTELLAEEVRRLQGIPITLPAEVPVEDRVKVMKSTGAQPGRPEDHAEYIELPFTPPGVPPKLASDIHHGHVWLAPTMFLDMPGNHMLQSSWREFPFYDIEWGSAFGEKILAVRPPSVGVTHTMQIVLPDPKKGGIEVFVGVEHEAMERLLNDPVWRKYAQAPEGL
ncbi:Trichothecene 3-O-acetyltransferase TRI101 [Colletotrichum sp. SAR11_57]|nr:Trichothecene 3-O-acetyltransferase TRI101 [Colletotrichum sp. SAR11_57]